jgi:hypothetical protein
MILSSIGVVPRNTQGTFKKHSSKEYSGNIPGKFRRQ